MQKKMIKRSFWLVLAIFWMALIFSFSHQKAEQSSEISGSLTYRITDRVNEMFACGWEKDTIEEYAKILEHPVRKVAHMTEYAILAWILLGNFVQYPIRLGIEKGAVLHKKPYFLAFIGTVFYAATDEIHQLFIKGRSGEVKDVCIDGMGALLGLVFMWIVFHLWEKHKTSRLKF